MAGKKLDPHFVFGLKEELRGKKVELLQANRGDFYRTPGERDALAQEIKDLEEQIASEYKQHEEWVEEKKREGEQNAAFIEEHGGIEKIKVCLDCFDKVKKLMRKRSKLDSACRNSIPNNQHYIGEIEKILKNFS